MIALAVVAAALVLGVVVVLGFGYGIAVCVLALHHATREALRAKHAFLAARLACFFAGHRWVAVKVHNPLLAHLHPTAGVDARCTRCGSVSMWGGQRYDEES